MLYSIIILWHQQFLISDVDECTFGTHDCDDSSRANCTNTEGSFICECKPGYIGDGKSCHILSKEEWFKCYHTWNKLMIIVYIIICIQMKVHVIQPVNNTATIQV